jgi:hypothetical protein
MVRGSELKHGENAVMSGLLHSEPPLSGGQPVADAARARCPSVFHLREASQTIYWINQCSENVNDFVRKMRRMQGSVCLCGKSTYV